MNILLEIFHSLACPKKPPTWVIMPKLKLLEFYFCYFLGKSFTESKEINNIFKDCSCHVYGTSEILVNALKADNNSTTCQLKLFFLSDLEFIIYESNKCLGNFCPTLVFYI